MMLFLPLLDILTCNSANKQSFQNPTKSLFAQCSIYGPLDRKAFCRMLERCFISWITSLNVQKSQIFAIFVSYLASIVKKFYETIRPLSFTGVGLLVLVVCWSLFCSPVLENSTLFHELLMVDPLADYNWEVTAMSQVQGKSQWFCVL